MKKMRHFIIILIILIFSFVFFAIMYFHANEKIQKSIEYNLSNNSNYIISNENVKLSNEYTLEYVKAISSNIINTFTFWFSFLSIIMVAFTILSIYTNSNVKSEIQEHVIEMQKNIQKEIDTSNYMLQSYKYYNNGEYIRSVSYCDVALESSVNRAQIYFDKALSLTSIKNENTSLARAISLYTKSIFQLNEELRNIKKKGENLERHKIINDNIALSYYNRGGCYFESKEYDKAMKDYHRAEKQYKKSYRCNDMDLASIYLAKVLCSLYNRKDSMIPHGYNDKKNELLLKASEKIYDKYKESMDKYSNIYKYLTTFHINKDVYNDDKNIDIADKDYDDIIHEINKNIEPLNNSYMNNISDKDKKEKVVNLNKILESFDKVNTETKEEKIDILLNKAIIFHRIYEIIGNDKTIKSKIEYILSFIKNATPENSYYNYLAKFFSPFLLKKGKKNVGITEINKVLDREIYLIGKKGDIELNKIIKYKKIINHYYNN